MTTIVKTYPVEKKDSEFLAVTTVTRSGMLEIASLAKADAERGPL